MFNKAHFLFKNKEELELTDKQVEEIKDLKISTKKDLIRKKAEIEILALDIKAQMYGDAIDTKAINELIDKKYELKKAKTKSLVEAYAALKKVLTKDQKKKIKELYKKCEKKTRSHQ